MKTMPMRAVSVVMVLWTGMAFADSDWIVAERGKPAACSIRVSDPDDPVLRYAAEEFRDHVRRMTDVELPIVDVTPEGRAVVLSSGAFEDDGFRLKVEGNRLEVKGGAGCGVLYGVYELLETHGGCGWYAMDSVDVPRRSAFTVPSALDDRQKPAFEMRSTSWYPVVGPSSVVHAARCRLNGPRNTAGEPRFGGPNPFRFDPVLGNCHTFDRLVPVRRHFKDHPEYFSEVKGVRLDRMTQLCLKNPDVLRIVISNVLARIRANPTCRYFGVSQNDWKNPCECPRCREIDDREGSHAGTVIEFVNKVAEAVEREFPDVIIETLAYQYSRKPPKTVRPRHNVMPCLCSIECDFSKPLGISRYEENVAFERDIRAWREISKHLYVWDYTVNFRHYVHAFPNVETLGPNIRFFRDSGVTHLFEQGCGQAPHADFAELKAWLIGKFAWNPDQPLEPLLDRFFRGYYGPAAPHVRALHDARYRLNRSRDESENPLGIYENVSNGSYPDDFYERCGELWNRAWETVKDDPVHRDSVRWGRFGSDYTRVRRFLGTSFGGRVAVSAHPERFDRVRWSEMQRIARERLLPMRKELPQVLFREGNARLNEEEERLLADFAAREKPPSATTSVRLEETFGYILSAFGAVRGKIVDDPLAENRRATVLYPGHGWSYYIPFADGIGVDRGSRYRLRVRARIDPAGETDGEALWTGVYDYDRKRASTRPDLSVKASAMSAGYAWYDVGVFVPSAGDVIWAAAGRRAKDGTFAYANLYIDKYELTLMEDGASK